MEYTNKHYKEYSGCIRTTLPSQYFPHNFLNDPMFQLLPEGFDVCYHMLVLLDAIHIQFYIYDSTVPLKNLTIDDVASSVTIYFNIPYKWSYNWTPFYYNKLHIPELWTNSDFEGFDSRGGGLGTFMMLCAMAYSESMNLHLAILYDASDGYRKDYNIYKLLGFEYVNDGHDMKGNVHEIYSKISHFIMNKGEKFKNKMTQLDTYFDNPEEDPDWLPGSLSSSSSSSSNRRRIRKINSGSSSSSSNRRTRKKQRR